MLVPILLQILLILLNAIFACAEIAVLSLSPTRLEKLVDEGNKNAKKLQSLTKVPTKFLSTIQVAITLAGFLGSAFAADNFAGLIVDAFRGTAFFDAVGEDAIRTVSVILITLLLSYITLVFGELVPKRIAMRKSEQVALGMAGFLSGVSVIFTPLVWLLTKTTNGVLRLLRIDPDESDEEVTEEGIRMMVDAGSESGAIEEDEKELIQNVFDFNDITAGEIATHRTQMVVLWEEDDMEVWNQTIVGSEHTYYPVCGETIDDILGILNSKIYFRLADQSKESVKEHAIFPAYFVPDSMAADDLLRAMRQKSERAAIVVDEFGGTHGLVTVNDLVEKIVGELDNDESIDEIAEVDENTYRILGSADLTKLEELTGLEFDSDATTVGGWVTEQFGDLPNPGDSFEYENLTVTMSAADERRVHEVIVKINPKKSDEEEDEEAEKEEPTE
ncbi:MAG TPA: HlyC/CorC family transporter [Clostridiales bacterium]|nr:HlyC/CorC family transporter [Clostridiales bacterium]